MCGLESWSVRFAKRIAVGSAAAMPAIPWLADARPWTSREVTTAHTIPGSLVVLGGGVVAVEMAQAYNALGSTVTLIEADRLLAREEPFAGGQVHEALVERGVDVRVAVEAQAVRGDGASLTVDLSDGGRVEADEILVHRPKPSGA
jgi:pyruvate/2-oxoglutarate dehydrogenase complex dihydrolipoamide dehydrogenase (E3) component